MKTRIAKRQAKTYDDHLTQAQAKAVRETVEAKTGVANFDAWNASWEAILDKVLYVFALKRGRARGLDAKRMLDADEVLVRQAFEQVLQIGAYASEDNNTTSVLVFEQKVKALKIGFVPMPTLDGLTEILRYYERPLKKS